MTAKKQAEEPVEIPASHEAEHEKDVVSEAKPTRRKDASEVAHSIATGFDGAKADGNRVTITLPGPNGLVQTFIVTVTAGITEF